MVELDVLQPRERTIEPSINKSLVRRLKPSEYAIWNRFVDDSPQGTLFHTTDWLNKAGSEFEIYAYFSESVLQAALPVMRKMGRFNISCAIHPPLTPYLGTVLANRNSKYVTRISKEKAISRTIASRGINQAGHCWRTGQHPCQHSGLAVH